MTNNKKEEMREAFQKLLDKLAREEEEPSENYWDKRVNAGHHCGILWAGVHCINVAKEFGIEGLRISQSLQDRLEYNEEYQGVTELSPESK